MQIHKVATLAVVATLLTVCFAAVSVTDAEPSTTSFDLGVTPIDSTDTTTGTNIQLKVNEEAYAKYKYTLTWYASASQITADTVAGKIEAIEKTTKLGATTDGSYSKVESGNTVLGADITVTKTQNGNGAYDFNFKKNASGGTNGDLYIYCVIKVGVDSASTSLAPLEFKTTLKFITNSTLALADITALTFEVGKPVAATKIGFTGTNGYNPTSDNVKYYAIGLPEGLSMSSDGFIGGLPVKATTKTTVKVYVITDNNRVFSGDLNVTITDPTAGYTYKITAGATQPSGKDYYEVTPGTSEVTLTITPKDGVNAAFSGKVYFLKDGNYTVQNAENGDGGTTKTYKISITGSGMHRILIDYGNGQVDSIDLYAFVQSVGAVAEMVTNTTPSYSPST